MYNNKYTPFKGMRLDSVGKEGCILNAYSHQVVLIFILHDVNTLTHVEGKITLENAISDK